MLTWGMNTAIGIAWVFVKFLKYASVLVMVAGVAAFGLNLLRAVGPRSDADSDRLSPAIWQAPGARFAFKLFGYGSGILLVSMLVAFLLPTRA